MYSAPAADTSFGFVCDFPYEDFTSTLSLALFPSGGGGGSWDNTLSLDVEWVEVSGVTTVFVSGQNPVWLVSFDSDTLAAASYDASHDAILDGQCRFGGE